MPKVVGEIVNGYKTECRSCNSLLTYNKEDVHEIATSWATIYKIYCPKCNNSITVDDSHVWYGSYSE